MNQFITHEINVSLCDIYTGILYELSILFHWFIIFNLFSSQYHNDFITVAYDSTSLIVIRFLNIFLGYSGYLVFCRKFKIILMK